MLVYYHKKCLNTRPDPISSGGSSVLGMWQNYLLDMYGYLPYVFSQEVHHALKHNIDGAP